MQLVASNMRPRDWARISRTCSAWQGMHFRGMVLWPNNTSELRWLANRLGKAQLLDLCCDMVNIASEEVQQLLARVAQKLEGLKCLALGGIGDMYEPPESTPAWLQDMFRAVADSLNIMDIDCFPGLSVPPMRNLRHVVARMDAEYDHDLPRLSFLQELPSLLTLGLENASGVLPMPALDLTGCVHLQAVSLRDLVPVGMRLPTGCSAALQGDWQAIVRQAQQLPPVARLSITDVFYFYPPVWPILAISGLSSMVNGVPFCRLLNTLHITVEGRPVDSVCQLSLGSTLGALKEVLVTCSARLVLTVAAPVSLHVLGATARGGLVLVADQPHALAASLSWLSIHAPRRKAAGEQVSCDALLEALAARSCSQVRDGLQRYQVGGRSHLYFPAGAQKPVGFWQDTLCRLRCGACRECLEAGGILDNSWAMGSSKGPGNW